MTNIFILIYGGLMRKRYLTILAPAALALMITGCGKAADTASSADRSSSKTESKTETIA